MFMFGTDSHQDHRTESKNVQCPGGNARRGPKVSAECDNLHLELQNLEVKGVNSMKILSLEQTLKEFVFS